MRHVADGRAEHYLPLNGEQGVQELTMVGQPSPGEEFAAAGPGTVKLTVLLNKF